MAYDIKRLPSEASVDNDHESIYKKKGAEIIQVIISRRKHEIKFDQRYNKRGTDCAD